jgi:hypothetical protein
VDRCQHCQFYERNPSGGGGGKSPNAGLCRRHAPSLSPINPKTYLIEGIWPTVRDEDWCGEFKLAARRGEAQRADALINSLSSVPTTQAPASVPRFGTASSSPASIGSGRGGDD